MYENQQVIHETAIATENVLNTPQRPTKSLLRLVNAVHVKLSNRDLSRFLELFLDTLLVKILDTPLDLLFAEKLESSELEEYFLPQDKGNMLLELKKEEWVCHVHFDSEELAKVRDIVKNGGDPGTNGAFEYTQLLTRSQELQNPPEILEEPKEDSELLLLEPQESQDTKKMAISTHYLPNTIIGPPVDIYIVSKGKHGKEKM